MRLVYPVLMMTHNEKESNTMSNKGDALGRSELRPEKLLMANLERLLYDRKSAAMRLSLSVRTIDYYLARGELEFRTVGRRKLITDRSLRRWASMNHYGPVKGPELDASDQDQQKAA
jgi:hypothetical protein